MLSTQKTVLLFGTFDIIHPGHRSLFRQAKKHGERLVICLARDKTIKRVKNKRPKNNEKKRLSAITSAGVADQAFLGNVRDKYLAIKKIRPDVICLGYDQKEFVSRLPEKLKEFDLPKTKIVRLKPYHARIYKTSKIINNRRGPMPK